MWKMDCEDTLQLTPELTNSLNLIVSGMRDEDIAQGWTNLRELEDSGILQTLINLEYTRMLMRGITRDGITNIHQVPKLMAYFAKYVKKKNDDARSDDGDPIVNDYVEFVKLAASKKDLTLLASMVDVLRDHPQYGGTSSGTAKACRSIVEALGTFEMPKPGVDDAIPKFRENAERIRESMRIICKSRNGFGNSDLIGVCLEAVYVTISDVDAIKEPGPGLIAILELVETKFIDKAVKWIMSEPRSDCQLERALRILFQWIPKWLRIQNLVTWIMEFMVGLERAKKYFILNRVSQANLRNILCCIILPMCNVHVTLLTTAILCRQPNPSVFHKLVKTIQWVFDELRKQDKNDNALACLQDLVDVVKALTERFPGYAIYDNLEKSFPVQPRIGNVVDYRDEHVWSEDCEKFSCAEIPAITQQTDHGKVGLTNLGNTCYMNSVLQALAMTRQFSQEVIRYKSPWERMENNDDNMTIGASAEEKARIMPKLQNLFVLMSYTQRRTISPTEILLASRPEYFTPKQQQDSSEFLCHLLDVLYEQEKSLMRQIAVTTDDNIGTRAKGKRSNDVVTPKRGVIKRWTTEEDLSEGITLERKTSQSLGDFSKGDVDEQIGQTQVGEALSDCHSDSTDSGIQSVDGQATGGGTGSSSDSSFVDETTVSQSILVHRVFGGESKITYQCAQCDTSSHNTDKFRDLQLCFPEEIADNQDVSVQDLMNYYLTPEKLTGENKYRCDKCTKLCDAQRIIKILRSPIHLILTLKHFHYDPETRLRTKLRHKVTYNETIQLPVSSCDPLAKSSPIAETYRLYAAVVHSGYSMDYGHYVTYARDSKQAWFKFNDSFVTRTSIDDFNALEPPVTPYILFYERIDSSDDSCAMENEEKPELTELSKHVRDLIAKDCRTYEDEIRHQADKKRTQRSTRGNNGSGGRVVPSSLRRHDNSDDENPPPSSCRGPIDIPANRFLF